MNPTTPDIQTDPRERFGPVRKSRTFNRILDTLRLRNKKILDVGCGYGEYLVNFGEGSTGITSTLEESRFGARNGLLIVQGNAELIDEIPLGVDFEGIWANNLFEHLLSPHSFLIKLKVIAQNDAVLVLGVPVVPRIASLMNIRPFRGALAIAHVNFFTRETLKLTVERAGWRVIEVRPFVFSNRVLDTVAGFLAPHVYVVARNNPHFAYHEKKLKEWKDESLYSKLLTIGTVKDGV